MIQNCRNLRLPAGAAWSLLWFAFPSCAGAQAAAADTVGVSTSAILQMLFGLALIIGLLFGGAYLLRRLNGGASFGHNGPMKVVGALAISPRERILLIEVGDTWLIVGVVPGQIKTLHRQPKGDLPPPDTAEKPFGQWLKKITEQRNENK